MGRGDGGKGGSGACVAVRGGASDGRGAIVAFADTRLMNEACSAIGPKRHANLWGFTDRAPCGKLRVGRPPHEDPLAPWGPLHSPPGVGHLRAHASYLLMRLMHPTELLRQ